VNSTENPIKFVSSPDFSKLVLMTTHGIICMIAMIMACSCNQGGGEIQNAHSATKSDSVTANAIPEKKTLQVNELTQENIREYSTRNACYLPLLKDSSLYEDGKTVGFSWEQLFNEKLDSNNPYRNRYLVGDFNVLNPDSTNRGVEEINPKLFLMIDFQKLDSTLFSLMDSAVYNEAKRSELESQIQQMDPEKAELHINFFNKVWKYKTPPIVRKYGVAGSKVYAAGQHLCLCEAKKDTLLLVGRFAISGKRQSPSVRTLPDGRQIRSMHESLPLGTKRKYYAGRYYISSKNWETQRKYDRLDIAHDSAVGGGNRQVTFYQGKTQLPNFLLMDPTSDYPEAMTSNGIHEVALSELSRGMLGSPNSIGCIRVTDFGSKFLRWWTPQNCNFFILYSNNRYVMKLDSVNADELYPFKTKEEGDQFRKWINEYMPEKAQALDIDEEGDHKNGYVIDAYTVYRKEYENYLKAGR
jgi:hypothetical protein